MRKRKQRKKWIFEKFIGNMAIYQICPHCGYMHEAGSQKRDFDNEGNVTKAEFAIASQYRYCPMCGKYLYNGSGELNVVWNERKFMDLMEEEYNTNSH
jgi:rubredoxin